MDEQLAAEGWVLQPEAVRELVDEQGQQQLRAALLDTDLKDVGSKCLPFRQRRTGTVVLQVSSVDDIGESRGHGHTSSGKRMLRVQLTDGHSTVTAIEYRPIPFLSTGVPPGTKVQLKDVRVQNGFVLLDEQSVKILGGRVPVLYEGWEIQRKYSGSARMLLRSSKDIHGAPMFRGLKAGQTNEQTRDLAERSATSSDESKPKNKTPEAQPEPLERVSDARVDALRAAVESNPEVGPSQNHAAAQRLLNRKVEKGVSRGRGGARGRRSGLDDGVPVLTLDEWEARKTGQTSADEKLAERLQRELNLQGEMDEAERIRQSMFNYGAERSASDDQGRGRGRGRRRGRAKTHR